MDHIHPIIIAYITPSPSIYKPSQFVKPVTPSDFISGHSFARQRAFLHLSVLFSIFYFLLLFIQSAGSLSPLRVSNKQTILQPSTHYPDTPYTIRNVLQSCRTILCLQMPLLRALYRPLLCLWTAWPWSTGKDCAGWLYLRQALRTRDICCFAWCEMLV